MRSCLGIVLAFTLLSVPARAQGFVSLLRSNDVVAGEPVVRIESPVFGGGRQWAALAFTGAAQTPRLVVNGTALLSVGDTLTTPSARVKELINLAGSVDNLAALVGLEQMAAPLPASGRAVLRRGEVVLVSGAPLNAVGLPAGTLCNNIYSIGANARDTVVALIDTGTFQLVLVRLEFDAFGVNVARTADLVAPQALPDGSILTKMDLTNQELFAQAVNEHGNWLWRVDATDARQRLVTRDRVLLRSGDPSPLPSRTILSLYPQTGIQHGHDLNDRGDWVALVRLSGNPGTDELLVKNSQKLAQEGDLIPALAPHRLVRLDATNVRVSDAGHVYWVALTTGPVGDNVALMRDLDVIARLTHTQIGGQPLMAISAQNFEITPDGRYLVGRVNLNVDRTLLRIDLGAALPISGCVASAGTLRQAGGYVVTGGTVRLALDGPAQPGSLVHLMTSLGEATPGNPCGLPSPFGEYLIDPGQRRASFRLGSLASLPFLADVALPDDPALVDVELFAQAAFVTPRSSLVLTNGMRFVIGAD